MIAKLPFPETLKTLNDLLHELGGISPRRIRLHPFPGTATIKDVLRNECCELVDGILVEKAMGYDESALAMFLVGLIEPFVRQNKLGKVTGEQGYFALQLGLVRGPDVAFTSRAREREKRRAKEPIPPMAPNLAIEVLSKSNTKGEMKRKRREYFQAGVEEVWMVDPVKQTFVVYVSEKEFRTFGIDDVFDSSKVLPGFSLVVGELFANSDDE